MESATAACEVRVTDPVAPESLRLVAELWSELGLLYPEINGSPFQTQDISGDRSAFVVAWQNGRAVGCGAFRPLPDSDDRGVAEIKRMYVAPGARRRGISRAILSTLEELALDCGYSTVRLETGLRQPNALRLYETAGYHEIPRYGVHVNDPLSACFEKPLFRAEKKR